MLVAPANLSAEPAQASMFDFSAAEAAREVVICR